MKLFFRFDFMHLPMPGIHKQIFALEYVEVHAAIKITIHIDPFLSRAVFSTIWSWRAIITFFTFSIF